MTRKQSGESDREMREMFVSHRAHRDQREESLFLWRALSPEKKSFSVMLCGLERSGREKKMGG